MRKKAKVATLTSVALSYLDERGFATARELGTVLPQMIGLREISEKMLYAVIENSKGRSTPSGKIVVVLERRHAQPLIEQKQRKPAIIVGVVDPKPLYNALGISRLSATCTGTIYNGTV